MKTRIPFFCLSFFCLLPTALALHGAELRFAGTLGNSDDSHPVFTGRLTGGNRRVVEAEGGRVALPSVSC